jgi:hypothetical protein
MQAPEVGLGHVHERVEAAQRGEDLLVGRIVVASWVRSVPR